jgi:hypothetical protein
MRVLVVGLLAVLAAPMSSASAAQHEHLRVRVFVLDFDPLVDSGEALTVDRGWNDPLKLDDEYLSDVAAASGGVVDQRIVRTAIVRGFPVKTGGFSFTNAQYLGCLVDHGPGYCTGLIDYRAVCPQVGRSFAVMGFSYERAVAEMLHDLGHRAEAVVQAGIGLDLWDRFDGQRGRYAQDFACPPEPDPAHPEIDGPSTHAGNAHFPPNAYCHYQYDRDHPVLSDADDWADFPKLTGRLTIVDASTWGATQRGFMIWWLGRFPRNAGATDGVQNDWWRYVFPNGRRLPPS